MGQGKAQTRYSGSENNHSPFRIGLVMDCNTAAYTVDIKMAGFEVLHGVPIIGMQGATMALDTQWLTKLRGSQVVLIQVGPQYYVLGTVTLPNTTTDLSYAQPVAVDGVNLGGADDNYTGGVYRNFQNQRATDFFDSDKIIGTSSGTTLALLNEGMAILKASPMAQFILGRFKDFFKLIARVGNFYSDFGEVNVTHTTDGRVGINTKGGASFSDETHPSRAKWTVQTWLGDYPNESDSRLFVKVNDPSDSSFVTMMFDITGNLTLETTNDNIRDIGRHEEVRIEGHQDTYAKKEIYIKSDVLVKVDAPMIKLNCSG